MYNTLSSIGKAFACAAMMAIALSSCIKEEAPNAEADITGVELDKDVLIRRPDISNYTVTLYANTQDSILAPRFTTTEGATIEPASGTPRKFFTRNTSISEEGDTMYTYTSIPQTYKVTSEDGRWSKEYTVSVVNNATPSDFHFDNIRYYGYDGKEFFHIFYESIGGAIVDWGSGNPGVLITIASRNPAPTDYPTSQISDGYKGGCAKLTTIDTGLLGKLYDAPIAAGNIFLGTFVTDVKDKAGSTHFGIPLHNSKPLSFSGYYKYKAGKTVTDQDMNIVAGAKDDFTIYCVVYEVTEDVPYLTGRDDKTSSLHSPNIVLRAEVKDHKETDEWTHFDVPFEEMNGKTFDYAKLLKSQYNIAIVCSSSNRGQLFIGAVGSTLCVDEFHIEYE